MRIVIALGGNALLRRGQPMTAENQRANIRAAVRNIVAVAGGNELVVAHGNGPQVGLLALQAAAYHDVVDEATPFPLDVLGAQTDAMIGYVIEQELRNLLPAGQSVATVLTMIEVDRHDPAFRHPTKPIGPVYDRVTAEKLAAAGGWVVAPDGDSFRRVVPSPHPKTIVELGVIEQLVEQQVIVICAGGGGIPTVRDDNGDLVGVEAVIDKDLASALLAAELGADLLVIATDVDGVYTGWGTAGQRRLDRIHPDDAEALSLPAGSMGPKVEAACGFARSTGGDAVIGALTDIARIVAGSGGTRVSVSGDGTKVPARRDQSQS
ncbi:carbamate kinase [Mycolicibacterium cosmeticum]|uniref:Carbamate kinase n=1 Tax=Mycolicibacterium cosmeticum TaxID=258533 RepID=W9AYW9_MYCCO|nr:carbamate kinase [Mycolicibacterium cosmeticum]TLH74083.1 carbamate kinase [Mycolicibacterium cosmeticum]CDO11019.1 carbamate kinase [Mycolicibacterium cosmeticum]